MPPHENFAAVLGLKQQTIQDMITILYHTGKFPNELIVNYNTLLLNFNADFFADIPKLILSSTHSDSFIINFKAWGQLSISYPQRQPGKGSVTVAESREVKFDATLIIPHNIILDGTNLLIGFDFQNVVLDSFQFQVLSGGIFNSAIQSVLGSDLFHGLLEVILRTELSKFNDSMPSIDISFLEMMLGDLLDDNVEVFIESKSVDNALLIGFNKIEGGIVTIGDINQLSDFIGTQDIFMISNAQVWIPNMREQLLEGTETTTGITEVVRNEGANLTRFSLSFRDGYLLVSGKAEKSPYGSVTFSFRVYPQLIHLSQLAIQRGRDDFWFDIRNIEVDVEEAWWVTFLSIFLGALTFGMVSIIIHQFISMVRFNVAAAIRSQSLGSSNRTFIFRLDEDAAEIRAYIEQFDFKEYGIALGLSFTPQFLNPRIICLTDNLFYRTYNHFEIERLRNTSVRYKIQLPSNVHPLDPKLRVRWVVRNTDTNVILNLQDDIAQNNLELEIADFQNISNLRISCRVYRALGDEITDFYNDSILIHLCDRLDQSKPFVRWYHHAVVPKVIVEGDGSIAIRSYSIHYRKSKIHRTDFPLRCTMVHNFSLNVPRHFTPHENQPTKIVYLNSLPFKLEDIDNHRDILCDYCFYGGPDKNQLKPHPDNQG